MPINRTGRPVTVDAGVRVPEGLYRARQAGAGGARAATIGGAARVTAGQLSRFRVTLAPWDVRVLNVHPEP